jgi:hypothetical protein
MAFMFSFTIIIHCIYIYLIPINNIYLHSSISAESDVAACSASFFRSDEKCSPLMCAHVHDECVWMCAGLRAHFRLRGRVRERSKSVSRSLLGGI